MTAVFFSSDPDDDFLLSFLTCTHTHTVNYYNNHYRVLTLTTVVAVIIPASASIEGSDLCRPDSSLFGLPRFFLQFTNFDELRRRLSFCQPMANVSVFNLFLGGGVPSVYFRKVYGRVKHLVGP